MKYLVSLLIVITFLSSCSNTENQSAIDISLIEPSTDWSDRIMPHFLDMDMEQFSYNKKIYNKIDSLLLFSLIAQNKDEPTQIEEDVFIQIIEVIENMMENMNDLSHDSHAMLTEYCHPLRELADEINVVNNETLFLEKLRKFQVYLLNFRQLFPEEK